jgi:hypothetical protein
LSALIRHLAYTPGSEFFLAAEFDRTVHVYRIGEAKRIATFDANLDFGGDRLTIHPKLGAFVAGAYIRYGITGYSLETGSQIWARPDLKKVQVMKVHPSGTEISCFFQGKAGLILDARTGETLHKYHGVSNVFFGEYVSLWVTPSSYVIGSTMQSGQRVRKASFALMDVEFMLGHFVLAEIGVPLTIRDVETTNITAIVKPNKENLSTLAVRYISEKDSLVCFETFDPGSHSLEMSYQLQTVTPSGETRAEYPVENGYAFAFLDSGRQLINASGQVIDCITGQTTFQYDFHTDGNSK